METVVIETSALGDRSYLVHDGRVALVIDPQRDIDRVIAAASDAGVVITSVAETHGHNDYVSGGLELARTTGADYLVPAGFAVHFERRPVSGGDDFTVGELTVQVVATPGHTDHHVSYVVSHAGQQAVFSGGSLLFGSVGRTDLVSASATTELTHAQWHSVRRLVQAAGDDAALHPTHGFGSFCSSGPATGAQSSTVGEQRSANHALTDGDEEHFVTDLIAGLTAYPSYYAHMGPANAKDPGQVDLRVPAPVNPEILRQRLQDGGWVVDLRNRVAFADRHLQGAISFEYGDGASFTTFLGWVMPWGEQLTLVGSKADVTDAIRDLSRIGIDSPDAAVGTDPDTLAGAHPTLSYPRVGWAEVKAAVADQGNTADGGIVVLDVRRVDEYDAGHVAGAVNIPLHELLDRADEVPTGTVWVHCGSGYRASAAASLLQRSGRDVVHVDAAWDAAAEAGVPLN